MNGQKTPARKGGIPPKVLAMPPEETGEVLPAPPDRKSAGPWLVFLAILAVATAAIYLPSLSGTFMLDDIHNIVENPAVRLDRLDPTSLQKTLDLPDTVNHRRPTAFVTFAFNYLLGRYDPFGYRLFNLAVLLASIPFAAWLAYLLAGTWHDRRTAGALALGTAAVWILHPLLTNGVAYIVQRMTSLCTLFCLISLCCFLKGLATRRPAWYGLALAAWLWALSTKEIAFLLPFLVVLYIWTDASAGSRSRLWLGRGLAAATVLSQGGLLWLYAGHASWQIRPFTLPERLLTQGRVVFHYQSLFLAPFPSRLNIDYDFTLSTSLLSPPSTLPALLFHVLLVGAAVRLNRTRPLFSFGILAFYLLQLLESTVLPLEIIFEHRVYFPSFFLALALGDLIVRGLEKVLPGKAAAGALAGALFFGGFLGILTHQRALTWGDPVALAKDIVDKSPGRARARHNLGVVLMERERFEEALPQLAAALRIEPDDAEIVNAMGNALIGVGRIEEAEEHFARAATMVPGYAAARNNLGTALFLKGNLPEAKGYFEEALLLNPLYGKAHYNLGTLLAQEGKLDEAESSYRRALDLDPFFPEAHYNLGVALARQGKLGEAREHFREEIRVSPDHEGAHYNLGVALVKEGRLSGAEAAFRETLRINPGNSDARRNLADIRRLTGP